MRETGRELKRGEAEARRVEVGSGRRSERKRWADERAATVPSTVVEPVKCLG